MAGKTRRTLGALIGVALLAFGIGTAEAQRAPSDWFGGFPRPSNPFAAPKGQRTQHQAGQFDYYVLSLSWSPSYCASSPRAGTDPQCAPRSGKPYSFVLHGLWPQYERGWPENCQTADRGFVPRPVAQRMLDIMPSEKLVFHEYRKHGVCSGLTVDGYFDLSRSLYNKVRIPRGLQEINDPRTFMGTEEVLSEFLKANPEMKPDNIALECGGPGNRLKEIRVCFDKAGAFRACGRNEDQKKLCNAPRVFVPPVRNSGPAGAPSRAPFQPGERRI